MVYWSWHSQVKHTFDILDEVSAMLLFFCLFTCLPAFDGWLHTDSINQITKLITWVKIIEREQVVHVKMVWKGKNQQQQMNSKTVVHARDSNLYLYVSKIKTGQ